MTDIRHQRIPSWRGMIKAIGFRQAPVALVDRESEGTVDIVMHVIVPSVDSRPATVVQALAQMKFSDFEQAAKTLEIFKSKIEPGEST